MSDRHGRRAPAAAPLVVSEANPRSFRVASGDGAAVYLAGSHIWNNLHDGMGPGAECAERPEGFDFDAYLGFLEERGHNAFTAPFPGPAVLFLGGGTSLAT